MDKTGTITYGNRLAADFRPVKGKKKEDLIDYSVMTSLCDATPEGKSVVELGRNLGQVLEKMQKTRWNLWNLLHRQK